MKKHFFSINKGLAKTKKEAVTTAENTVQQGAKIIYMYAPKRQKPTPAKIVFMI